MNIFASDYSLFKIGNKVNFWVVLFCKDQRQRKQKPLQTKEKNRYHIEFHVFFPTYFLSLKKKRFFCFVFSSVNATNFDILREKVTKFSISPRWDKNPWDSSYILSKAISYFRWKSLANAQERHKQLGHTQCFFFGQNLLILKPKIGGKNWIFFPSVNSTNFALYVGKILLNFQSHKTEKKNPGHTLSYGYTKDLPLWCSTH